MGLVRFAVVAAAGTACLAFALPEGRTVSLRLFSPVTTAPAIALSAVVFATGVGLSGNSSLAAPFAVFAAMVPGAVRAARRRRERVAAAAAWPDFLAVLRGRIAAGETIPDAALEAASHLAGPFTPLAERLRQPSRVRFTETVADMRQEWRDPIADRVLTTLATASEVGGSRVDAVVAALSKSVADEVRLRRAHDAALTQQRLTAAVALVAPWALLLLTIATNPQASHAFARPSGRVVILVGLIGTLLGRFLSARAARLAEPPRVLV